MNNLKKINNEQLDEFVKDWSNSNLREDLKLCKAIAEGVVDNVGSSVMKRSLNNSTSFVIIENDIETHIWFGIKYGNYIGWQVADLINGSFTNHRGDKALNDDDFSTTTLADVINWTLENKGVKYRLPISLGNDFYEQLVEKTNPHPPKNININNNQPPKP